MRKIAAILIAGICASGLADGEPASKPADQVSKKLMDEYGDMLTVLTLTNDQKSKFRRTLDAAVPEMAKAQASYDALTEAYAAAQRKGDRATASTISKQRNVEGNHRHDLDRKLYEDMMSFLTHGQQLEWKDYCRKRRNGSATTQPSSSPAATGPATQPAKGLLGLSREQIAAMLHSKGLEIVPSRPKPPKSRGPEAKKRPEPTSPSRVPMLPAVEIRQFPWRKIAIDRGPTLGSREQQVDVVVGFDDQGRARYLCGYGVFTPASAQEFLGELAPGAPNQEAGMIFPPLSADYEWYTDKEVWRHEGTLWVHRSGDVVTTEHKDKAQKVCMVSRGASGYSVWTGDYGTEQARLGYPAVVKDLVAMDDETFWRWTLAELTGQVIDGVRSMDFGGHNDFQYVISTSSYEEALGFLAKKADPGRIALYRLGMAVSAALRNPRVPVEVLQPAAAMLALKDGKRFLQRTTTALESGAADVRPRAARLLAYIRDPDAVDSLISALRRNPQLAEAVFALRGITGEDLGNDLAKWQQWQNENKDRMQELKRQSKALLESTSQPASRDNGGQDAPAKPSGPTPRPRHARG